MAVPTKDVLASVVVLCFFALSRAQEVLIVESYADSACSGTVVQKDYKGVVNQCALAGTWNGVSYWQVPTKDANSITGLVMLTYYSDANCTTRYTGTSPQLVEAMAGTCTSYMTDPDVWRTYTWSSSTPALLGLNAHIFQTPAQCSGATLLNALWITSLGCLPAADINGGRPLVPKSQLLTATGNGYTRVDYTSTYNCTGPSTTPASQFTCDCSCGSYSGFGMQSWSCGNALTPSPKPSCLAPSSTNSSTTSSTNSSTGNQTGQQTCLSIKRAYQAQKCCENPMGEFKVPTERRLSSDESGIEVDIAHDNIIAQLEAGMQHLQRLGGAVKARMLAKEVMARLEKHIGAQDTDVVI